MSVVAVAAGKASPGATTVAVALTLCWPGPVVLVDGDTAGGDVEPGLLAGRTDGARGLLSWTVATRHASAIEAAAALAGHVVVLPEAPDAWVLPGLRGPAQAGGLAGGGWSRVATALARGVGGCGRDVIVDAGRLSQDSCWPVLAEADLVLLVVAPTARSMHATEAAIAALRARLGDLDRVALVVNGDGPYPPAQVGAAVGVPVLGVVPGDARAAAALVDGGVAPVRGLTRSRLLVAVSGLTERIRAAAREGVSVS